ncbi:MAG: extracellular solute-binding protein [Actinomycetota bacterium]|nr:extracellular solute-binding protein [Actinomycetota bacterium]
MRVAFPSPFRLPVNSCAWLLAALAAVLLASCGQAGARGSGSSLVRVYSARHYDLERAFDEFARQTGISVQFLTGSDGELRERIKAEGDQTQADVFMVVDAGNLYMAGREGLFQTIDSQRLRAVIPEHLRDPEGLWFGLSRRARTIVYSSQRVDPSELSTYEALAEPQWRGRLCLRNSTNVYTQSLVASLIAHHGYQGALGVVRGWVANRPQFINNDVEILQTVAAGGCDIAITNHYYLARLIAEDPDFPVRVFWANQDERGTHVNISGAGVTAAAEHPEEAVRLLEWLATDGQSEFVNGNYEYPVNPNVRAAPVLVEHFGSFQPDLLPAAEYGARNVEAVKLMDEAGYT